MPFKTRRFLKEEILRLEYRVKDLEERLCPCESHKLKWVGTRFVCVGMGEHEPIRQYKCEVCGKEMEDIF